MFSLTVSLLCRACPPVTFLQKLVQVQSALKLLFSRYTVEEQKQILQILNDSNAEGLSRFEISKSRINNLQQFRQKRGQFSTIEDVLEVDGLGVKVLEKLCNSILKSGSYLEENVTSTSKKSKSSAKSLQTQILTPPLRDVQKKALQTAVGIHVGVNAVTWAAVDCNSRLLDWNIFSLDYGSKRLHLISLFETADLLCKKIPKADVYVLEDKVMSIGSVQQPASISINLQNCQIIAMLVASLNKLHNPANNEHQFKHLVFFLRSRLPARLFRTLVGAERVSAQSVVLDILSKESNTSAETYSHIEVSEELKESYLNRTSTEKESMCWSLLLIMTFMDLIVHQRPEALKSIKS